MNFWRDLGSCATASSWRSSFEGGEGIPAKSYYEESQLDSEAAQMRFALFKLFLDNEDRVALRYATSSAGTGTTSDASHTLGCDNTARPAGIALGLRWTSSQTRHSPFPTPSH